MNLVFDHDDTAVVRFVDDQLVCGLEPHAADISLGTRNESLQRWTTAANVLLPRQQSGTSYSGLAGLSL